MTDLFAAAGLETGAPRPLADRLRPTALSDVIGQDHLLGPAGKLTRLMAGGALPSLILWGPPGVGKTTIAQLLAAESGLDFEALSAVFSGVKDLRAAFERADGRRQGGRGTLLFVDEIHRFNRAQQDGFLPFVERGTITLIGATTENPSFELNGALLSRASVLSLRALDDAALERLLVRAEAEMSRTLALKSDARPALRAMAGGDGRYLLNLAEQVFALADPAAPLDRDGLESVLQRRAAAYDKDRDGHYDLISALHKSVRGSDPDAALYWFARMLEGGEDPLFLARRLVRMASEDIGLADPMALLVAGEAARTYERLGSPEGELALAQAVLHLASAPKSNAAYVAYKAARSLAAETGDLGPPMVIRNAPTALMKQEGYGGGYVYDHDAPNRFSGQNYFPDGLPRPQFYAPKSVGAESHIKRRLDRWAELRETARGPDQSSASDPDQAPDPAQDLAQDLAKPSHSSGNMDAE